jgi:hypothetical protein
MVIHVAFSEVNLSDISFFLLIFLFQNPLVGTGLAIGASGVVTGLGVTTIGLGTSVLTNLIGLGACAVTLEVFF